MKENRCRVRLDGVVECAAYSSYIGDTLYSECDHYESKYFGDFGQCKHFKLESIHNRCECTNEWAPIAKAMEEL